MWEIRSNEELRCIYQGLDLEATTRKSRLRWLGCLHRMEIQRELKMALG
jgi:hypothetical protein